MNENKINSYHRIYLTEDYRKGDYVEFIYKEQKVGLYMCDIDPTISTERLMFRQIYRDIEWTAKKETENP